MDVLTSGVRSVSDTVRDQNALLESPARQTAFWIKAATWWVSAASILSLLCWRPFVPLGTVRASLHAIPTDSSNIQRVYVAREVGNCDGFKLIKSKPACTKAARLLHEVGLIKTSSLSVTVSPNTSRTSQHPYGCYFRPATGQVYLNLHGERGSTGTTRLSICKRRKEAQAAKRVGGDCTSLECLGKLDVGGVAEWLRSVDASRDAVTGSLLAEIDGPALLFLSDQDMETDLDVEDAYERKHVLEARDQLPIEDELPGLEMPTFDFWTFYLLDRTNATTALVRVALFPRLTLHHVGASDGFGGLYDKALSLMELYVDLTIGNVRMSPSQSMGTSGWLGSFHFVQRMRDSGFPNANIKLSKAPLPLIGYSPPASGKVFEWLLLLAPYLLLVLHAAPFFNRNYWVTFIFTSVCTQLWLQECLEWAAYARRVRNEHRRTGFTFELAYTVLRAGTANIANWLSRYTALFITVEVLEWTLSEVLFDMVFYVFFIFLVLSSVKRPIDCFCHFPYQVKLGMAMLFVQTCPLLFDDTHVWDVVLYWATFIPMANWMLQSAQRRLQGRPISETLNLIERLGIPAIALFPGGVPPTIITVTPANTLPESISQINTADPATLKTAGIRVRYTSEAGVAEDGIDAGGLRLDWYSRISTTVFVPGHIRQEKVGEDEVIVLRPEADTLFPEEFHIFLGRFLALSINDSVPLGVQLAQPLCKAILAVPGQSLPMVEADDLSFVANAEFHHLQKFRNASEHQDAAALGVDSLNDELNGFDLSFIYPLLGTRVEVVGVTSDPTLNGCTGTVVDGRGRCKTNRIAVEIDGREKFRSLNPTNLQYEGQAEAIAEVAVCVENVEHYMKVRAAAELFGDVHPELTAVRQGFHAVIRDLPNSWIEFQSKIEGECVIPLEVWRDRTVIKPGDGVSTDEASQTLNWFFGHLNKSDGAHRQKIFQWVTGRARLPPNGFEGLPIWRMTISVDRNITPDHLPVAHTCFPTIDMPLYDSEEQLAQKLGQAIQHQNFGIA